MREVNSIVGHHGLVIPLLALGDFYMLDVCCSLRFPFTEAILFPSDLGEKNKTPTAQAAIRAQRAGQVGFILFSVSLTHF